MSMRVPQRARQASWLAKLLSLPPQPPYWNGVQAPWLGSNAQRGIAARHSPGSTGCSHGETADSVRRIPACAGPASARRQLPRRIAGTIERTGRDMVCLPLSSYLGAGRCVRLFEGALRSRALGRALGAPAPVAPHLAGQPDLDGEALLVVLDPAVRHGHVARRGAALGV